jgi:hypothetical protein
VHGLRGVLASGTRPPVLAPTDRCPDQEGQTKILEGSATRKGMHCRDDALSLLLHGSGEVGMDHILTS